MPDDGAMLAGMLADKRRMEGFLQGADEPTAGHLDDAVLRAIGNVFGQDAIPSSAPPPVENPDLLLAQHGLRRPTGPGYDNRLPFGASDLPQVPSGPPADASGTVDGTQYAVDAPVQSPPPGAPQVGAPPTNGQTMPQPVGKPLSNDPSTLAALEAVKNGIPADNAQVPPPQRVTPTPTDTLFPIGQTGRTDEQISQVLADEDRTAVVQQYRRARAQWKAGQSEQGYQQQFKDEQLARARELYENGRMSVEDFRTVENWASSSAKAYRDAGGEATEEHPVVTGQGASSWFDRALDKVQALNRKVFGFGTDAVETAVRSAEQASATTRGMVRGVGAVGREAGNDALRREIVEREARYRAEQGIRGDNPGDVIPREIGEELDGGFPMLDPTAASKQKELYERWASNGAGDTPPPRGFVQKLARFGGDVVPMLAEVAVLRRVASPLGRAIGRRVVGPQTGAGVAAGAAYEASLGKAATVATDALAGGVVGGMHSEDGEGVLSGAAMFGGLAGTHFLPMPKRLAAQAVMFGAPEVARGDWQNVLIQGVFGPIAFNAMDVARFGVKGWRQRFGGDPNFWRGWGGSTGTGRTDGRSEPGTGEPTKGQKLVYRWETMREQMAQRVGERISPRERDIHEHEMAATANSIGKLYNESLKNPRNFTPQDRGMLRDFVGNYRPEAVSERWEQSHAQDERIQTGTPQGNRVQRNGEDVPGDVQGRQGPRRPGGGSGGQHGPPERDVRVQGGQDPERRGRVDEEGAQEPGHPADDLLKTPTGAGDVPTTTPAPISPAPAVGPNSPPPASPSVGPPERHGDGGDGGDGDFPADLTAGKRQTKKQKADAAFHARWPDTIEALEAKYEGRDVQIGRTSIHPENPVNGMDAAELSGEIETLQRDNAELGRAYTANPAGAVKSQQGRDYLDSRTYIKQLGELLTQVKAAEQKPLAGTTEQQPAETSSNTDTAVPVEEPQRSSPPMTHAVIDVIESPQLRWNRFVDSLEPAEIQGSSFISTDSPQSAPRDVRAQVRQAATELIERYRADNKDLARQRRDRVANPDAPLAAKSIENIDKLLNMNDRRIKHLEPFSRPVTPQVPPAVPPPKTGEKPTPKAPAGGTLEVETPHATQAETETRPGAGGRGEAPTGAGVGGGVERGQRQGGGVGEEGPDARPGSEKALGGVSADAVPAAGSGKPAAPGAARGGEKDRSVGPPEDRSGRGEERPSSVRGGPARLPVPTERGGEPGSTGAVRSGDRGRPTDGAGGPDEPNPTVEQTITHTDAEAGTGARDYIIQPDAPLFREGAGVRAARANVAAIKLVKRLEQQDRLDNPTPDEQETLVQYTGWGTYSQVFDRWTNNKGLKTVGDELRELVDADVISQEEYDAARASTTNAMYTPPAVIGAMYDALTHMGFSAPYGATILEPAMGVGHFFGLMPEWLLSGVRRRVGVELDAISAAISRALYPVTQVQHAPFQRSKLPEGLFDLVISNVPFGAVPIGDRRYPKSLRSSIHDYYFVRSMDLLREGGTMAFVTSHHTMDKATTTVREHLASQADLLGAIRLHDKALPGTQIITDIVFLRKRYAGETPGGEAWIQTGSTPESRKIEETYGSKIPISEYFIAHPDMVLGSMGPGTMHGRGATYTIAPREGESLERAIAAAVKRLPTDKLATMKPLDVDAVRSAEEMVRAPDYVPAQSFYLDDDGNAMWKVSDDKVTSAFDKMTDIELYDGRAKHKAWLNAHATYEERKAKAILKGHKRVPKPPPAAPPGVKDAEAVRRKVRSAMDRVIPMLKLRQIGQSMIAMQATGAEDADWKVLQVELNETYDAFVKRFGALNEKVNQRALGLDYHTQAFVGAFENRNTRKKTWVKAPIFSKRIASPTTRVIHADDEKDALAASLSERGRLDVDYMAGLLGRKADDVVQGLRRLGLVYKSPAGRLIVADEYLSGNVREKLEEAEAAAKIEPEFQANVRALQVVQPPDLSPSDIDAYPGAPWIDLKYLNEFARHLFGDAEVRRTGTDKYKVSGTRQGVRATAKWGTLEMPGPKILEQLMQLKRIEVKVRVSTNPTRYVVDPKASALAEQKSREILAEFVKWMWGDASRSQELLDYYNRYENNIAPRTIDGGYLKGRLPGLAFEWVPRDYQLDAVAGILLSPNRMIFGAVGSGKTMIATIASQELLRTGRAKKVMIVVQNSTLNGFQRLARQMYPSGEFISLTAEMLTPAHRQSTYARIAFADTATIVIPHQVMTMISMGAEEIERFFNAEIDRYRVALAEAKAADESKQTVKEIETAIERLNEKLAEKLDKIKTDEGVAFERLGVDFVIYDESQAAKNLAYITFIDKVKGLGNPSGSNLAFDLKMKAEYLQRIQGGGGLVFMTGTPVDNSLVEIYNIQRYLDPRGLMEKGIKTFDDWVRNYGRIVASTTADETGGYVSASRLSDFNNLGELKRSWMSFTTVVTPEDVDKALKAAGDDVGLPTLRNDKGENAPTIITSPMTSDLKDYQAELKARKTAIKKRGGKPKKGDDIVLSLITDAKHAALDIKLRMHDRTRAADSKIDNAAREVAKRFVQDEAVQVNVGTEDEPELEDQAMTQAIFMNLGLTPGVKSPDGYTALGELIAALVENGVPREQIAWINEADKPEKQEELFAKVNAGQIRVIIGSIKKMGIGVNIQSRLKAVHFMDPPWTPAMLVQATGRMVRQGNINKEVEALYYVQQGSMDEYMFDLVQKKHRANNGFLTGGLEQRRLRDVDVEAEAFAMMSAAASNEPVVKEFNEANGELMRLRMARSAWMDDQQRFRAGENAGRQAMTHAREEIKVHTRNAAAIASIAESNDLSLWTVDGKTFEKVGELGAAIIARLQDNSLFTKMQEARVVAKVGEFDVEGIWVNIGEGRAGPMLTLSIKGRGYGANLPEERLTPEHGPAVGRVARGLVKAPQSAVNAATDNLERGEARVAAMLESQTPFQYDAELAELEIRVEYLRADMEAIDRPRVKVGEVVTIRGAEWTYAGQVDEGSQTMIELVAPEDGDMRPGTRITLPVREAVKELGQRFVKPAPAAETAIIPTPGDTWTTWSARVAANPDRMDLVLSMVPAHLRPGVAKWVRTHGPDHPMFGMGAAWNWPDPRGRYKRFWDRLAEKMQNAEPGFKRALANWVGRGIYGTARWGIDPDTWRALERAKGGVRSSEYDARAIANKVDERLRRLEKEYGRHAEAAKSAWNNALMDALEGYRPVSDLSEDAQEVYYAYAKQIDALTDEFLEMKELHKYATAFGLENLIQIIKNRREGPGTYLRMIFRRKPGEPRPKGRKYEERARIKGIQGGMFKPRVTNDLWTVTNADRTSTQFADEDSAREHAQKQLDDEALKTKWGESLKERVRVRGPKDPEDLVAVGFEPEPNVMVRMARTLVDMRHNIEMLRLYDLLAETTAQSTQDLIDAAVASSDLSESARRDMDEDEADDREHKLPPGEIARLAKLDDLVAMPDSPVYGPLAGQFVPYQLRDALTQVDQIQVDLMAQIKNLYSYMWKSSKVTLSPATWGRNLIGQAFFLFMDDLSFVRHYETLLAAVDEFRTGGKNLKRLIGENEISRGYAESDLGYLRDLLRESDQTGLLSLVKFQERIAKGMTTLGNYYDMPDQLIKLWSYLRHRDAGWSHLEAVEALRGYPNYARQGEWARWARRSPFGAPFVAFTDSAVKVNTFYARNKPGKLVAAWMFPGLLTAMAVAILGLDDEELELVNQSPGRANKGVLGKLDPFGYADRYFQPLLPFRDERGRVMQLDLRWIFPLANDFRVSTGAGGLGFPMLMQQPGLKTLQELAANRSLWTGRDIRREKEAGWVGASRMARHAFENLAPLPTIAVRGWQQIYDAATGKRDQNVTLVVLKQLFGINVNAPWVRRQDAYRLIKQKFGRDQAEAAMNLLMTYNAVYRSERDKPIRPRSAIRSSIMDKIKAGG